MPDNMQFAFASQSSVDLRIDKLPNLEDAFNRFDSFRKLFQQLENDISEKKRQYLDLEREKILNLIPFEEARRGKDNIRSGFQRILDEFKEELPDYLDVTLLKGVDSRREQLEEVIERRLHRRYEVKEQITEGNSATLFLLEDTNRKVVASVLKIAVLPPDVKTEVQKVAALGRHDNIIQLIEQSLEPYPFIVLSEYVNGVSLASGIDKTCPRPLPQAAEWLSDLAKALERLRANDIRHLNVRPSKIYIKQGECLVISPFDTIKSGKDDRTLSRFMEDCLYLAPELLKGNVNPYELQMSDLRIADQFSLGLVAYKTVTGKDLFKNSDMAEGEFLGTDSIQDIIENRKRFSTDEVFRKQKLEAVNSSSLAELLDRALRELPTDRFKSLGELSKAFSRISLELEPAANPLRRSFEDCINNNPNFVENFYSAFIEKEPKTKDDFHFDKSSDQQRTMLKLALEALLDFDSNTMHLQRIINNEKHHHYTFAQFATFLETFIETVKKNDPTPWNAETADAWENLRQKLLTAIEQILADTKTN